MPPPKRYGYAEAATYLGITERTLRRIKNAGGGIRYYKVGRRIEFTQAQLDEWLTNQENA